MAVTDHDICKVIARLSAVVHTCITEDSQVLRNFEDSAFSILAPVFVSLEKSQDVRDNLDSELAAYKKRCEIAEDAVQRLRIANTRMREVAGITSA